MGKEIKDIFSQKKEKKHTGLDRKTVMIMWQLLKDTITIAGLMRNFAPAFMAFLASLEFKTVPACKRLQNYDMSSTFMSDNLLWRKLIAQTYGPAYVQN